MRSALPAFFSVPAETIKTVGWLLAFLTAMIVAGLLIGSIL